MNRRTFLKMFLPPLAALLAGVKLGGVFTETTEAAIEAPDEGGYVVPPEIADQITEALKRGRGGTIRAAPISIEWSEEAQKNPPENANKWVPVRPEDK